MNYNQTVSMVRRMIGQPTVRDVDNKVLWDHITDAQLDLSAILEYQITTFDQGIRLVAGQQEYGLPAEVLYLLWAEWNDGRLTPNDPATWDNQGNDWRQATASIPNEYAVERRRLILNPPPSSGAITTDPYLVLRAITSIPGLADIGITDMPDVDIRLACAMGAIAWLAQHPSDENSARAQHCVSVRDPLLQQAKGRINHEIKPHHQGFQPLIYRRGTPR